MKKKTLKTFAVLGLLAGLGAVVTIATPPVSVSALLPANTNVSAIVPSVHAQEPIELQTQRPGEQSCTEASLIGRYGFQRNGTANPGGPVTALGHITFDGMGHTEGSQTISRNGAFSVQQLMPTYTVNADCTGSLVDATGTTIGTFVIVHGGSEVLGMSLTPGNNVAIHFERMVPPGNAPPASGRPQ